jgi:hypothetical protein
VSLSVLWSAEKGGGKGATAAAGGEGEGVKAALAALGRVEAALAPRG